METAAKINGHLFAKMLQAGYANLRAHAQTINDLNVFPIPDGDTGDNMLLTLYGGMEAAGDGTDSIGETTRLVADAMLLSARGNSGVILSQIFEGIAQGLSGVTEADQDSLRFALRRGAMQAYRAVLQPTEGTMLTVVRHLAERAAETKTADIKALFEFRMEEAKIILEKTPEFLPVLKKAGVVDSGGAGLLCINEGMFAAYSGTYTADGLPTTPDVAEPIKPSVDFERFNEHSTLEFGYCTELLLRLLCAKCDPGIFDVTEIINAVTPLGDSIAATKSGSIVRLHIHTMNPGDVLNQCRRWGEFLQVKIENMSLQHNSLSEKQEKTIPKERRQYAVVAAASGDGIKALFTERGADVIVDGGQSANPSAEDFLRAFEEACAGTIFVLPNNSNIILTAKQAAELYQASDVRVIESRTIGEGYAALSMLSYESGDTDTIAAELADAMTGVVTAEISRCVRNTDEARAGDYIGFVGKEILAANENRQRAVCDTADRLIGDYDICLILRGKDADPEETQKIEAYLTSRYPAKEIYLSDGLQEIYDYVLILE